MHLTDIHTHVLPGLDDGAVALDDSVEMLRQAYASGTRTVVATPHLYSDYFPDVTIAQIHRTFRETISALRGLAAREDHTFLGEMTLGLGAEHYLSPRFLEALESGEVIPLAGGRHLLLEFPVELPLAPMMAAVRKVAAAGYAPIVAHVERYSSVRRFPQGLRGLVELGTLCQVNARSLLGCRGHEVTDLCRSLLEQKLAHIVATDGHDVESRTTELGTAFSRLQGELEARCLEDAFLRRPAEVLHPTGTPVGGC